MNIRIPQSGKASKLAKSYLESIGLKASHAQCLELMAKLHGYQDFQAMQSDKRFEDAPALKAESANEYALTEKASLALITVANVTVRVQRTAEGVSAELFPEGLVSKFSEETVTLTFKEAAYAQESAPRESSSAANVAWILYDKPRDAWYWSARRVPDISAKKLAPEFVGTKGTNWDGPFECPDEALESAEEHFGEEFEVSWIRSDRPLKSKCSVLQDHGEYLENLSITDALSNARDMRDSGVGGVWTVETDDGELLAIFR